SNSVAVDNAALESAMGVADLPARLRATHMGAPSARYGGSGRAVNATISATGVARGGARAESAPPRRRRAVTTGVDIGPVTSCARERGSARHGARQPSAAPGDSRRSGEMTRAGRTRRRVSIRVGGRVPGELDDSRPTRSSITKGEGASTG